MKKILIAVALLAIGNEIISLAVLSGLGCYGAAWLIETAGKGGAI